MFLPFWVCFSVSALLGLFIWSPGTGRVAPVLALAAATWLVDCNVHLQTILCDKVGVLNLDQRCINYVDPSKSMVLV